MPTPRQPASDERPDSGRTPPADRPGSREERRHQEDLLDEALQESFPASDPPSISVDR